MSHRTLLIWASLIVLIAVPAVALSQAGEGGRCDGMSANIVGTKKGDVIDTRTTAGPDVVDALAGGDAVTSENVDRVCLGKGSDTANVIMANTEGDFHVRSTVLGGDGADRITGGLLVPDANPVVVDGGRGDDWIQNVYRDLRGGKGNDTIIGSDLADHIDGGPENDRLSGGGGDDVIEGGPGRDVADGGPGLDVCHAEVEMDCELN